MGCCNLSHDCQPGLLDGACGVSGALCQDCTAQVKQCSGGACKDCTRWATVLPSAVRGLALDTDNTIYAGGTSAPQKIYLAALDGCGTLLRSASHLPATASAVSVSALTLAGNDILVGGKLVPSSGTDPQQGMYGRFSKQTLAASWVVGLYGGTSKDEIWDLVQAGGSVWMSGTTSIDTTVAGIWGVKASSTTSAACGFGLAGAGYGRSLTAPAGSGFVYFTGGQSGKGLVGRVGDTACSISPCSSCSASWQTTFQDGTHSTEGRGLLVVGGNVYVAGFSSLSNQDLQALVVRVDLATGTVQNSYVWNPTSMGEMFMDLATDGTSLYVVGMQGYDGTTAQAAVHKLSMPSLAKVWSVLPGDAGAYWSVATSGANGLLLAGGSAGGGVVRRCLTSGLCQ